MSFPVSPSNGDYYTNDLGTTFQYVSADDKWTLTQGGIPSIPAGTILGYGASTIPSGFLICDGSAVSRATYGDLFAVIGTTYGVGDGSTTFNVPDLSGRVPAGYDSGDGDFDLGDAAGAKTHQLTVDELASHEHAMAYNYTGSNGVNNFRGLDGGQSWTYTPCAHTGGNVAHNNLQPYLTVNYIIKYTSGAGTTGNISNAVYGSDWNGVIDQAPSKNAVYDKIETKDKYLSPIKMIGVNGFAEVWAYWNVVHADVDAQIRSGFICPETRDDWKFVIISRSATASRTDSGAIYVGAAANGETQSDTNLLNGVNFDLVHTTANVLYFTSSTTFSLTEGDFVSVIWAKDNNAGTGNLEVWGTHLTHD